MNDLKYLLAYILPLSTGIALALQGPWAWATVVLSFVIIPFLEQWLPRSAENMPVENEYERSKRRLFDVLLYLNLPVLYALVVWYLVVIRDQSLSPAEIAGLTLSTGILVGAIGINVAHELGHRAKRYEQLIAKWMLLTALYQHFTIEHNRGHHKNVATGLDPATAWYGEVVFPFWFRSIAGGWRNAWRLERERLQKAGLPFWSGHNEMLRFQIWQLLWLGGIGLALDGRAVLAALAIALIGVLLLETINYVEHYGLRRRLLPSGQPEPVLPEHSWNSDHELGRIMLYELTRHSDHHYKASRKYQILRHVDESPQLPYGYPASVLLALVPPLWFRVMNRRVPVVQEQTGL